jgi:hypothetical protein
MTLSPFAKRACFRGEFLTFSFCLSLGVNVVDMWDTGDWDEDGVYTPSEKGGWPGRDAYREWPHAFDSAGFPLPERELLVLNSQLQAAGRLQKHWVGNLNHVSLAPFQHRIRSIPTKRGDLLIWHRGCPHGNGFNLTNRPRMAQFVNFSRATDYLHHGQLLLATCRARLDSHSSRYCNVCTSGGRWRGPPW